MLHLTGESLKKCYLIYLLLIYNYKDEDEGVDGDLVAIDDSDVENEEIIASSTESQPARPTVIEEESESDLETESPSAQPTAGITSSNQPVGQ